MLLVDDDQAELRQRREHREPGAEHDAARRRAPRPARPWCAPTSSRPLCSTRCARPGNASRKRASSCGVRPISGTSTSACAPRVEHLGDQVQVDLGLAAAGDAVQQERRESRRAPRRSARSPRACAGVRRVARRRSAPTRSPARRLQRFLRQRLDRTQPRRQRTDRPSRRAAAGSSADRKRISSSHCGGKPRRIVAHARRSISAARRDSSLPSPTSTTTPTRWRAPKGTDDAIAGRDRLAFVGTA